LETPFKHLEFEIIKTPLGHMKISLTLKAY
jgi:hypothetical protein